MFGKPVDCIVEEGTDRLNTKGGTGMWFSVECVCVCVSDT